MTATEERRTDERRPGELTARELGRWTWRQITSMRTALLLLLLLALAAIPGSVIPQADVDSLAVTRWKDEASFQKWFSSQDFQKGHARPEGAAQPVAMTNEVWNYEVEDLPAPGSRG